MEESKAGTDTSSPSSSSSSASGQRSGGERAGRRSGSNSSESLSSSPPAQEVLQQTAETPSPEPARDTDRSETSPVTGNAALQPSLEEGSADPADVPNDQLVESAVTRITMNLTNYLMEEVIAEAIDGYWARLNFTRAHESAKSLQNSFSMKMFRRLASAVRTAFIRNAVVSLTQCSCFKLKQIGSLNRKRWRLRNMQRA